MFNDLFKDYKPLYHYTTFENAVRILATKKIIYSRMDKLNDPLESFRPISFLSTKLTDENAYERITDAKEELEKYQQISFSMDTNFRKGFLLNNMWGSYANKGMGVCLVFDEQFLLDGLNRTPFGPVRYQRNYNPDIILSKTRLTSKASIRIYISNHSKSLFFRKSKEWEHEQEFRIVRRFDDTEKHYLELFEQWNKTIKCVIFMKANDVKDDDTVFDSSSYKAILELLPDGCKAVQLSKDLEGNDFLMDNNNVLWGEVFDVDHERLHLS